MCRQSYDVISCRGGREDRGNRHTSYFEKPDDRSDMEKISEKERKESASQFLKGLSKQYAEVQIFLVALT